MENKVTEVIKARRSIRSYKPEQISSEELECIIEAGRFAPSGGNNQTTHMIVIQDQSILAELKQLTTEEFAKMEIKEDTYSSIKSSITQSRTGKYDFTKNAPTLIVVANKRGYGNAMADCACVLENMMIAATSINIGSCWVNQLRWLADNEIVKEYVKNKLNIREEEIICGGLILGYSNQDNLVPLQRKGNPVTYIK